MKKNLFTLEILMFTLVFTFLAGCSNSDDDTGNGGTIGGSTLAAKLQALKENAVSDTEYRFELTSNESLEAQDLSYGYGKENITIRLTSSGGEKIISLAGKGSLFTIDGCGMSGNHITLILENGITLQGSASNNMPLIFVCADGTLIMNDGAKISGNNNNGGRSWTGGGVYVRYRANFIMEGGEISGNTSDYDGGGVYADGAFTMKGGKISGNTASVSSGGVAGSGGGVYARSDNDGIFTMTGGEISNNTASSNGGGVYVHSRGYFTMEGGEIFNNTAAQRGGGAYVDYDFTMEGGKIFNNVAASGGGGVYMTREFKMIDGEITGNTTASGDGGGVYAFSSFRMTNGKISSNAASNGNGGGVCAVNGFTMINGEISGNTASLGGGVYSNNGAFSFSKTGGTIYGYTEGDSNSNKATEGNAVYTWEGVRGKHLRETTAGPGENLSGIDVGWEN